MNDTKFETWLGSIVNPEEPFYLIAENETTLKQLIERAAKIGYEKQIVLAFILEYGNETDDPFDLEAFKTHPDDYTIIDIRNYSELKAGRIFNNSLHIPLYELRERSQEIPVNKPILVHCAGGYRSAAGSSIIKSKIHEASRVYDLSEAVKNF